MFSGILLLMINLYCNFVRLNDLFCLDENNVKRELHYSWVYNGCLCECDLRNDKFEIFCANCFKKTDIKSKALTVLPNGLDGYFWNKDMEVYCSLDTAKLEINTTEGFRTSNYSINIGGDYNDNNETVCAYCVTPTVVSDVKCYKMLGSTPEFTLNIPNSLYPIGKNITVYCDLKPNKVLKYFREIVLISQIDNMIHSGFINGEDQGEICFSCRHVCLGCVILSFYRRCIKPLHPHSLLPNISTVYSPDNMFILKCEPNDDNGRLIVNSSNAKFASGSVAMIDKITETICAYCYSDYFIHPKICYTIMERIIIRNSYLSAKSIFNKDISDEKFSKSISNSVKRRIYLYQNVLVKLEIVPAYSIYLFNVSMIITCLISPDQFNDSSYGITLLSLNATVVTANRLDIEISGKDKTTICFQCGSNSTNYVVKCYNHFRNRVFVTIVPNDTMVFLKSKPLHVICIGYPKGIESLMTDIKMVTSSPNLVKVNDRHFIIENIIQKARVCFICGNRWIENANRCYNYFAEDIMIEIQPNYQKYYYAGQALQVICIVLPSEVLKQISGIKINWHNTTQKVDKDFSIQLDGSNFGDVICISCGHVLIKFDLKCYEYLDPKNPNINILPNYKVFIYDIPMEIKCVLSPDEFYDNKYGISLASINASGLKLTDLTFQLNALDNDTVCFKCGSLTTKFLTKCFLCFNMPIILNIEPSDSNIYAPQVTLDVSCNVSPSIVVTNDYITDIKMHGDSSQNTQINDLNIKVLDIKSQKKFCFICGNLIITNVTKCYEYLGNAVSFKIVPSGDVIYFKNPTTIQCIVTPPNSNPAGFSFDIFFLKTTYYKNIDIFSKLLSIDIPMNDYKICLTCGIPGTNISKCYILRKLSVSIEIVPKVAYYLVYDDRMDITCQVNPLNALPNFPNLQFSKVSSKNYKKISETHYRICNPKSSCTDKFCFTCSEPTLQTNTKCYTPIKSPVNFYIFPKRKVLFYMIPHRIYCAIDKPFNSNEKIGMEINGLKSHEYIIINHNLTITIYHLHYLLNRRVTVVCGTNYPSMKSNQVYNLTANVTLDYIPRFLIYMGFYQSYQIKAFFRISNFTFIPICTLITPSTSIFIKIDIIHFHRYIRSGTYQFRCLFPNTTNNYILELKVLNISINAYILPQQPTIYYIYDPHIQCIYEPKFIPLAKMEKKQNGLLPDDFVFVDDGIMMNKKITARNKKFCISCRYLPMFLVTKCFNLRANLSFYYYPKLDYYTIYYKDFIVTTFFKHLLISDYVASQCKMVSGPMPLHIIQGNISLISPLLSGTYKIHCHSEQSTTMHEVNLNVFSDPIRLHINPSQNDVTITTSIRVFCEVRPVLKIGTVNIFTRQSWLTGKYPNEMIIPNSLLYHQRCICFTCSCANISSVRKCYTFSTELIFEYMPIQKLYFAWNEMVIETFFKDISKPDRTYLASCIFIGKNISASKLGEINISPKIQNGSYFVNCQIPNIAHSHDFSLIIYGPLVRLVIIPNDTDVYIFSMPSEIMCDVYPAELTFHLPDIQFLDINSTQFQSVSLRKVIIGGVDHDIKDVICVTCGHHIIPFTASKCFSPYTGLINVSITPTEWEIYYLMPHTIRCNIVPRFMNNSKVLFVVIGIPKSMYRVSSDLTIRINSDKTLVHKDICVICGNRSNMNQSRCYRLTSEDVRRCFDYIVILMILFSFIMVMVYISKYEVM